MTYVQYINCDKWKKVIGITLWIGATLGLGILLYSDIQYELNYKYWFCIDDNPNAVWHDGLTGNIIPTCHIDQYMVLWSVFVYGLNIANYFMIWYVLNAYYQIIEIRCGEKPKTDQVKQ